MKRFAALILGAALSLSLSPAAHAQSLGMGSLGTPNDVDVPAGPWDPDPNRPTKEWTEGVAYEAVAWDGAYPGRGIPLCDIRVTVHEDSAYNVPVGDFTIVDKATGVEVGNPSWGQTTQALTVVQYPSRDYEAVNPSWFGTTRDLELLMEREDGRRASLGSFKLRVPETCPVGESERKWLASGWVVPTDPPVTLPVSPWSANPTEPTDTWSQGVAYDLSVSTDQNSKTCGFVLNVHKESTADLPDGKLVVRDNATGTELLEQGSISSTHFLTIFRYRHAIGYTPDGTGEWPGTFRSFTLFIEAADSFRSELGDITLEVPKVCPVSIGNGKTVATGWLTP